jgi:putative membrane protein
MESVGQKPPEDPRVRFAAERTLLAWVRTGLALMGFGFVVARFGLFLREFAVAGGEPLPTKTGWSAWIGVALVLLGVVVSVLAALEHRVVLQRIERGEAYQPPRWSLGLVVAALLAAIGLGMTAFLVMM